MISWQRIVIRPNLKMDFLSRDLGQKRIGRTETRTEIAIHGASNL